MHPLFKSPPLLLLTVALWAIAASALAGAFALASALPVAEVMIWLTPWYWALLPFCLSNYYFCLKAPIGEIRPLVLFATLAATVLTAALIWLGMGWIWCRFLQGIYLVNVLAQFGALAAPNLLIGVVLMLIWTIIHYNYLYARSSGHRGHEDLQHTLLINQIELQTVKATIHPHFLYNSLSMLANLALSDAEKVHDLCIKMADFLRYSVNFGKRETVSVEEEVAHVRNYLSIEQERFGGRLAVEVHIEQGAHALRVIPLVLFPLVENSIKHGVASRVAGGYVSIAISTDGRVITFVVTNSFDPMGGRSRSTGLGQEALRKRLQGYYGPRAKLTTTSTADEYRVQVAIPHDQEAAT